MEMETKQHEDNAISCQILKQFIISNKEEVGRLNVLIDLLLLDLKNSRTKSKTQIYEKLAATTENLNLAKYEQKILIFDYIVKVGIDSSKLELVELLQFMSLILPEVSNKFIYNLFESYEREADKSSGGIEMTQSSVNETRLFFKLTLKTLLAEIKNNTYILNQFPSIVRDDILKMEVVNEEPWRGGIYDISPYDRKVAFSNGLLSKFKTYWELKLLNDEEREIMCWLYFLHELRHIQQGVDSNTYLHSRNSITFFQKLDYIADAFAVKNCFIIKNKNANDWNKVLSKIIQIHISGGEVFSTLDDGSQMKLIEGTRLHRQIIWHFQYARAFLFNPEATLDQFDIDKNISFEIFKIESAERRTNFCGEAEILAGDLRVPLTLHILWGEVRIIYPLDEIRLIDFLLEGIFDGDLNGTVEAFRPLFSRDPRLIGRMDKNDEPLTSGENLNTKENQRLNKKLSSLQTEWDLRTAKIEQLRKSLAIEAGESVKFQLSQQVKSEEGELEKLESEIKNIEAILQV